MLKVLENLQNGLETPKSFQNFVTNHRILNLDASYRSIIESKSTTIGINVLDIDKTEDRYLLCGAKDGALSVHDLMNTTGKPSYKIKLVAAVPRHGRYSHEFCINSVQWYPFDTGAFTTSGMDARLKIWSANIMKPVDTIQMKYKILYHHMSSVTANSLIAVAMEYPHAVLVDPRTGSSCQELRGHKTSVSYLQWSPSCEHLLATGGVDAKIYLWDIRCAKGYLSSLDQHNGELDATRQDLVSAHNGQITGLRFTDDGLYLVSRGADYRIRLWDVALSVNTLVNYSVGIMCRYRQQRPIEICCNTNPPVVFCPDATNIAIFDLFSGSKIHILRGHFTDVNCCVYRPSTNQLFSSSNDKNVLLFTPDTQQEEEYSTTVIKTQDEPRGSILNIAVDNWSDDELS